MKYLTRFTPAESLVILMGDKTPLTELLKYTFIDLLLKEVLALREVERQASGDGNLKYYKYVTVGNNFSNYSCKPHEIAILSIFLKNPDSCVLFKNLVKSSYQIAKNEKSYYRKLTSSPNLKGFIAKSSLQRLMGNFSFTFEGCIVKSKLKAEFLELERNVSEIVVKDRAKAIEVIKSIGGNIFLYKALKFSIMMRFEKELFEGISMKSVSQGYATGWVDFGQYSETFESSCSSHNSEAGGEDGSGGCSSGCSGCGGCGGD